MPLTHRLFASCAALAMALLPAPAASADDDTDLEHKRSAFREVYAAAELGDWRPAAKKDHVLKDYVLWPDLRAAWLKTRVRQGDFSEIESFLDDHGALKPGRELRYRYALRLAADDSAGDYLALYRRFYQGLGIARLDCLALHAELLDRPGDATIARALDLWLVGESQVDECNPVFDRLRSTGAIGAEQYRQRFELAIEARQFTLARYLSRQLGDRYSAEAESWLAAQDDPARYLAGHDQHGDEETHRLRLIHALKRVAFSDPGLAAERWREIGAIYAFSPSQRAGVSRHIALWTARRHAPDAHRLLASLAPDAVDAEVGRWLVRSNLRRRAWGDVLDAVDGMPEPESDREEWRYWQGIALIETGAKASGEAILAQLAASRSYYGFLSADRLGEAYDFRHSAIDPDEATMDELSRRDAFVRARELFLVGLEGRGRSEWDAAVGLLGNHEKLQAAHLAHRWGWHSRAIVTAAAADHYDDLDMRYPLPYRESFRQHSAKANISDSWALGVARSESLFMRDIRSSAGAIGIMQLLPDTGRRTARQIRFPYSGSHTLTDPDSNILLGTAFLGKMYQRFDSNRVLATAAYNAGPLQVEGWLPRSSGLDARIWIENIPFDETREYVRRVLTGDTIFHWRLTGETRRVLAGLPEVVAAPPASAAIAGSEP